jgi:uncharacterized protein involved in type VI secretion and phage assembly
MNLISLIDGEQGASHGRVTGPVVGIVSDNRDPDGLGRVRVRFPSLSDGAESNWARVASPMAGSERGLFFLPEVDDEVLVAFEHCDPRRPIVIGSLWNGVDLPPETNADGENKVRLLRSRAGHELRFEDGDDAQAITLTDKDRKNYLRISISDGQIQLVAENDLTIEAGQKLTIRCDELELSVAGAGKVEAQGDLEVTSAAQLTLNGDAQVNIN